MSDKAWRCGNCCAMNPEWAGVCLKCCPEAQPAAQDKTETECRDDLPGMLALAKGVAEQKWPHSMDAKVWAEQFYDHGWRVWKEPGGVESDQIGLMIGWFANAIMAGYDTAQQRQTYNQCNCDAPDGIHRHDCAYIKSVAHTPAPSPDQYAAPAVAQEEKP